MKVKIEKIYYKLPVVLQNVLLSLYGLYIHKIRHGKKFWCFFKQFESYIALSQEDHEKYILNRVNAFLSDSQQFVPYYRNVLHHTSIPEITCINDLQKLPMLEKKVVRSSPESFIDERYDKKKLLVVHTTGTTGSPLKIYCNSAVRKKNYAFYSRYLQQVGINYFSKRVTFGGRIVVPHTQVDPPFWRHNYFQKNVLFSSYHLTERNIPAYILALQKLQPEYIDSYPSSLFTIAKYAQQHGTSLRGITKAITTSAETLFSYQRSVIEEAFGVKIFDQYGSAEMCVFIGQCSDGTYHVHSDYGIVEFLREDGSFAMPGEEAEVVCTGLINPVMPLIRYRIGDRVVLSEQPCKCGSHFPSIDKIIGRMDDVILTPDGRRIGRLGSVLKGFPIVESQYYQKVIEEVDVLIVKDHGFCCETEKNILVELKKRVGDRIKINLKYVAKIERSKGCKFKSIISDL